MTILLYIILILSQNRYLRSDKALSKANPQVPLEFYLLLLLYVYLDYHVACLKMLFLFARYCDLYLFSTVSFTNLTLIFGFQEMLLIYSVLRERRKQ